MDSIFHFTDDLVLEEILTCAEFESDRIIPLFMGFRLSKILTLRGGGTRWIHFSKKWILSISSIFTPGIADTQKVRFVKPT